jgi:serine/threonine protein phosphatase 1
LSRIFAISDIHGCAYTFHEILNVIGFSKEDELYLLGDYIDRGPRSRMVLDKIMQLKSDGYLLHCLRGNHEQMMLEAPLSKEYAAIWLRNGGTEVMQEFGATRFSDIPKPYFEFIEQLDYWFERDKMILVHAGFKLPKDGNNPLELKKNMLWIRKWEAQQGVAAWLNGRKVIHGHTPQTEQQIRLRFDNPERYPILNIDNGCAYNSEGMRQLCCVELTERKIFFQKNID